MYRKLVSLLPDHFRCTIAHKRSAPQRTTQKVDRRARSVLRRSRGGLINQKRRGDIAAVAAGMTHAPPPAEWVTHGSTHLLAVVPGSPGERHHPGKHARRHRHQHREPAQRPPPVFRQRRPVPTRTSCSGAPDLGGALQDGAEERRRGHVPQTVDEHRRHAARQWAHPRRHAPQNHSVDGRLHHKSEGLAHQEQSGEGGEGARRERRLEEHEGHRRGGCAHRHRVADGSAHLVDGDAAKHRAPHTSNHCDETQH
mmetsp:Transcript_12717/g.30896  ORF Transcript_12717/g.30896 Transcript_12717/m.30896 type:complete len:254 (+) Transcript_12717:176-937(+)